MKNTVNILRPTSDQVDSYLDKWESLENYKMQEKALDKLFDELCPMNKNISDILLKVAALNDFYSTNIFSVFPVAQHILSQSIDSDLKKGDLSVVSRIQVVTINGVEKNFYSFATKYCSHHKPEVYPIYDYYVERVLCYFRNQDSFAKFANKDLKNYEDFTCMLKEFKQFYGLENFAVKQIDRYIWQLGKEFFPRNYK